LLQTLRFYFEFFGNLTIDTDWASTAETWQGVLRQNPLQRIVQWNRKTFTSSKFYETKL